jgi:L-iditol 2-dehydrogenase
MTVAELAAYRSFRLRELPDCPPAPDEVQVRVESVGICGSDLHYFLDGHIGDTPATYPQVLGHEPAGVITALGSGVSGWSVGDRVALDPPVYCYHCEWCMSGRHNLCERVRFFSSPGEPGFFRNHANVPVENLLALPANLGFDEGSLFEPISIILHSFRFGQPRMGETAAVLGAGPIGLSTIACLRLAGVKRIFSVEPVAERREMAVRLGADVSINPRETDPVHEVLRETGGRGVDITFDCATQEDTVNQALYMTAPAGRAVITGVPQAHRVALDFHHLRRKELGFFSVRRANHTGAAAVQLLREHPEAFAPMITHRLPMASVQRAFEMLGAYEDGVTKIVLRP